ncbi:MAG: discoidin domain-containing protein [Planctomycetota bacterium]
MVARNRTVLTLVVVAMAMLGLTTTSAWADVILRVDFNSNQDSGGDSTTAGDPGLSEAAHNQEGWSSYHANHEVIAEFTTADYDGITVTPDWPNTTDNRARQSIDRGTGNDNNWDDAAGDLNLVTDFIGIDTRTGNGGNGNWDGTTGTPTYMTLALGGLAAGNYDWTSFHHDTEHVYGPFAVWLSTDGGETFTQLDDGVMTDSTPGGSPDSGATEAGPDANSLPSTYHTSFRADGTNDVVFRFAPYSETAVHRQIWGMNGFVLSRGISLGLASSETPVNQATDVPYDTPLNWTPGQFAQTHDVYVGTVFDDVNDADRANPMDVLVSQDQAATGYAPEGVWEFGQTYYWRVDEVNGAPDNTIYKGEVWSFTVEPMSYAIEGVIATSNGVADAGSGPENAVNGSGLNADDQHSVESSDMWLASPAGDEPLTITFEFDRVYKMHEMLVWNYNVAFELLLGFGVKDATVEYSTDGAEWATLGDVALAQATAKSDYAANTTVDLQGVPAQYVRLIVNSAHGVMGKFGLGEVRFMQIPAHARQPQPADETADVPVIDTALSWRAGREAVTHEVYLSTDPDALELIDATSATTVDPGALELGATYYWKIDEVNEADDISVWEGNLWSFTTQPYLVVDDFESYDDEENAIFDTWLDGFVNETGSTVGYFESPFAEQTIVHGGRQSMPLEYNNAGVATSEADFDVGQDWSINGIQSLTLYFYGDVTNSAAQLYVKIDNKRIDYDGPAINITRPSWQMWSIDLTEAGNVSNVNALTIGIEGAGATGLLFIDDVRLYPEVLDDSSPDITGAGDTVQGVPNDGVTTGGNDNGWPAGETPDLAIDDDTATKFLHFKGETEPTGIQITPLLGATTVNEITFTTANDAAARDPVTFELYGSSASIDGPYTLIASGDIVDFAQTDPWPRFTKNTTPITFDNDVAYTHYQVLFPTVRDPSSANSMQIAEVELIDATAP